MDALAVEALLTEFGNGYCPSWEKRELAEWPDKIPAQKAEFLSRLRHGPFYITNITLLMFAAAKKDSTLFGNLLDADVNPYSTEEFGHNLFSYLFFNNDKTERKKICEEFVERFGALNFLYCFALRDHDGISSFESAIIDGDIDLVDYVKEIATPEEFHQLCSQTDMNAAAFPVPSDDDRAIEALRTVILFELKSYKNENCIGAVVRSCYPSYDIYKAIMDGNTTEQQVALIEHFNKDGFTIMQMANFYLQRQRSGYKNELRRIFDDMKNVLSQAGRAIPPSFDEEIQLRKALGNNSKVNP